MVYLFTLPLIVWKEGPFSYVFVNTSYYQALNFLLILENSIPTLSSIS